MESSMHPTLTFDCKWSVLNIVSLTKSDVVSQGGSKGWSAWEKTVIFDDPRVVNSVIRQDPALTIPQRRRQYIYIYICLVLPSEILALPVLITHADLLG